MDKEKIIQLARDAGLTDPDLGDWMTDYGYAENAILKFTSAIIAATKEEDAKICDYPWNGDADTHEYSNACNDCAYAIRASKEQK